MSDRSGKEDSNHWPSSIKIVPEGFYKKPYLKSY